jgi:hypothetical protein
MDYRVKSIPHVVAVVIATAILWVGHGFEKLASLPHAVSISWVQGMRVEHPWLVLLIAFVIVVALSRLQELTADRSFMRSIEWPIVIWLLSAAPILYKTSSEPSGTIGPLLIRLVALVCAGLVLVKGKGQARDADVIIKAPYGA